MDTELKMDLTEVKDDALPGRDGTFTRFKKYTFWLGKYGPLVERIPLDSTDPNEFGNRVAQLRAKIIANQQL